MQYQFGPGPLKADYDPLIQKLKSDIGIVEDGNTATHAIATGQYVVWKGAIYVAKSDIQIGETLSSENAGNLTACTKGSSNDLISIIKTLDNTLSCGKGLPANIDFDTFVQVGKWSTNQSSTISTFQNKPAGMNGGEVILYNINFTNARATNVSYGIQLLISKGSNSIKIQFRPIHSGAPTGVWKTIASTSELVVTETGEESINLNGKSFNADGNMYRLGISLPSGNIPSGIKYAQVTFYTNLGCGAFASLDNNSQVLIIWCPKAPTLTSSSMIKVRWFK